MISLGNVKDMIMILSNLVLIRRCVASKPYQFNISVPLTITDIQLKPNVGGKMPHELWPNGRK